MFKFIAFDLETTGTNVKVDEIIEIGAVLFESARPAKRMNLLVKPKKAIPADATRVNGISNEMVADKPELEQVIDDIVSFFGDALIVAHNAPFDVKFLATACRQYQRPTPSGLVLDTHSISKHVLPELFNHRLENLVKHFKLKGGDFHRAEADAAYCGFVFIELLKLIPKGPKDELRKRIINLSGGELYFPKVEPQAMQMSLC